MKVAFLIPSKSSETWDKDPLIIKQSIQSEQQYAQSTRMKFS